MLILVFTKNDLLERKCRGLSNAIFYVFLHDETNIPISSLPYEVKEGNEDQLCK